MIYLGDDAFDSELMWARLQCYRHLGLPMGCGTNNAEGRDNLKEVGLVGGHAYSILDVREAVTRRGEAVRLLRVRKRLFGRLGWGCACPPELNPFASAKCALSCDL